MEICFRSRPGKIISRRDTGGFHNCLFINGKHPEIFSRQTGIVLPSVSMPSGIPPVNPTATSIKPPDDAINRYPNTINTLPDGMNRHPGSINNHPDGINDSPESINDHPGTINCLPEAIPTLAKTPGQRIALRKPWYASRIPRYAPGKPCYAHPLPGNATTTRSDTPPPAQHATGNTRYGKKLPSNSRTEAAEVVRAWSVEANTQMGQGFLERFDVIGSFQDRRQIQLSKITQAHERRDVGDSGIYSVDTL